MSIWLAGVDIGGTKCAVSLGVVGSSGRPAIVGKRSFSTPHGPQAALERLLEELSTLLTQQWQEQDEPAAKLSAIGISCGGPLDSGKGLVLSPPNLPGWDAVDAVRPFLERFGVPTFLCNDANACALAEWSWGAGQGCDSMIFLTFGTGMGAGLILGGKLYEGANGMAGEVGHMRLEHEGPVGYGKSGSFEGFCSGGGIAQLARTMAEQHIRAGIPPQFCLSAAALPAVTAQLVAEAAHEGDALALDIYRRVGMQLGRALALLVDVLNPQRIVIGSIYLRQRSLLEPIMLESLRTEALPQSLAACCIVPAGLGEQVGDYAGLSVAWNGYKEARV